MTIASAWADPTHWSFILGVYRYEDEVTFCFGFFSVVVGWNGR